MAGILVGLVGISAIKFADPTQAGMFVFPHIWLAALIGGIIFGFGMTLSGGCCVGSLWRAGEGQVKLMVSVIGMLIMMPITDEYIKEDFFDALPDQKSKFLPNWAPFGFTLDYFGAFAFILILMGLWYYFVRWNDRTRKFCAM